eukprot:4672213-Amphidinium_carterae.1
MPRPGGSGVVASWASNPSMSCRSAREPFSWSRQRRWVFRLVELSTFWSPSLSWSEDARKTCALLNMRPKTTIKSKCGYACSWIALGGQSIQCLSCWVKGRETCNAQQYPTVRVAMRRMRHNISQSSV